LKYAVGLLLATYGTFWAVEGLGLLHGGESLSWPGGDAALLGILAGWLLLSRILVVTLPRLRPSAAGHEREEARA
jgi:Ca2+/H+ antiporter, TMEM165/GDT1 family